MNASNLIRWSGLSAIAAGILFMVIQVIHPSDVLASVTTGRWAFVHIMGIVMCILALFGVTGLYARQVNSAGWLGLAGYLLFSLFWALTMAFQFVEAFISPKLASQAPEFVEGILGIAKGKETGADMGALPELYAITGGLYALGGLIFGIATFRAGILPRWSGVALAVGAISPIVLAALPHPLDRTLAVPMGLSLAWLGYALWDGRRELTATPVRDTGNGMLRRGEAR